MIPGSSYCPCGQLTRRVPVYGSEAEKIDIPESAAIGGHSGGFTMLRPSRPAWDGLCGRCNKDESYFEVGKQS